MPGSRPHGSVRSVRSQQLSPMPRRRACALLSAGPAWNSGPGAQGPGCAGPYTRPPQCPHRWGPGWGLRSAGSPSPAPQPASCMVPRGLCPPVSCPSSCGPHGLPLVRNLLGLSQCLWAHWGLWSLPWAGSLPHSPLVTPSRELPHRGALLLAGPGASRVCLVTCTLGWVGV